MSPQRTPGLPGTAMKRAKGGLNAGSAEIQVNTERFGD
jgi:hypothetical protein